MPQTSIVKLAWLNRFTLNKTRNDANSNATRGYRTELHGLRGLAIFLVMIYHVFTSRVSGGVDVFLMISAFLLTGSFVKKLENAKPLGITGYWLKAFKRLMPPAVVTVIGTVILVLLFYPQISWRPNFLDGWASAAYFENWNLISKDVDYYAFDRSAASPFQHFWSLSVQGQIFLVWPLIIGLSALAIRYFKLNARVVLGLVFAVIFVASLWFSIVFTAENQKDAYFNTFTRAWEFAGGSLAAIVLPSLERVGKFGPGVAANQSKYRVLRGFSGWLGLIILIFLGIIVDVQGLFPGWVALVPIGAATLVILAGQTGFWWSADRLLSTRIFQFLGDISYGLYLVHWPLLVSLMVATSAQRPTLIQALGLIALSLVLAWALTRFVDSPIRRSPWLAKKAWRQLMVIALTISLVWPTTIGLDRYLGSLTASQLADVQEHPGAGAVGHAWKADSSPTVPQAYSMGSSQTVELDESCSAKYLVDYPLSRPCRESSFGSDDKLIIVYGSSRAEQLMGAVIPIAKEHGYKVVSLTAWGCVVGDEDHPECEPWHERAEEYILEKHPLAVVMHTGDVMIGEGDYVTRSTVNTINRFTNAGIDVIGVRPQPRFLFDPYECKIEHPDQPCSMPASDVYLPVNPGLEIKNQIDNPDRFYPVDLSTFICPDGLCQAVYGGIYVFIDQAHLSWAYSATLAKPLEDQLADVGWQW